MLAVQIGITCISSLLIVIRAGMRHRDLLTLIIAAVLGHLFWGIASVMYTFLMVFLVSWIDASVHLDSFWVFVLIYLFCALYNFCG